MVLKRKQGLNIKINMIPGSFTFTTTHSLNYLKLQFLQPVTSAYINLLAIIRKNGQQVCPSSLQQAYRQENRCPCQNQWLWICPP